MAAVLSQGPLTSRLDLEQTILFGIATLKLKSLLVDQSAQGGPVQKPHGLPVLALLPQPPNGCGDLLRDRKSTRLNSSHVKISYAVYRLIKKILITYANY